MRLALIALIALVSSPALADAVTYKGTLGGREIVLELTEPSHGAVAGRFAFLDTGESIPLNPSSHDGDTYVLVQEALCTPSQCSFDADGNALSAPAAATWELTVDGTSLSGVRRAAGKDKQQAIDLVEIGRRPFEGEPTPMTLRDEAFYALVGDEALDLSALPFENALALGALGQAGTSEVGGAGVVATIDPRTLFAFPRVQSLPGGEDVAPLNAILSARHARINLQALDCLSVGFIGFGANEWTYENGGTLGDYDAETVELTFASPTLLSWTEAGSTWCGGAHPNNHFDLYTYDVAAGAPLDFGKIFSAWVPRVWGAPLDEIADDATIAADPTSVYWGASADLVAWVRDRIPTDVFGDDAELNEVCVNDPSFAEYLRPRFVAGPSVVFALSGFPHVSSVCNGDLMTVPLAELEPFLAPGAADYLPELSD